MHPFDGNGVEEFVGREALSLDDEEARGFLSRIGYGVLAVAKEGQSYAFPTSFGYDGESTLYFQFERETDSRKMAFVDATERATYVVYNVQPPEWRSVIVEGSLSIVAEEDLETAYQAHRANAWVPMNVFSKPLGDVEFEFYELDIDAISGYGTDASADVPD